MVRRKDKLLSRIYQHEINTTDRKELRRKINKTNRERSKRMERAVARYLKGRRTAMSGGGYDKSDCYIPLPNEAGHYLVECKYSEAGYSKGCSQIYIPFSWLDKMQREAIAMRARFAVLCVHYHYAPEVEHFIFIREGDIAILESITGRKYVLSGTEIDARYFVSREIKKGYNAVRSHLVESMGKAEGMPHCYIRIHTGRYLVLYLSNFKTMLE